MTFTHHFQTNFSIFEAPAENAERIPGCVKLIIEVIQIISGKPISEV